MKIDIDRSKLKENEVDVQALLKKVASGKAILFTGAGFSVNTKNLTGSQPPFAKELAEKICKLGNFKVHDDLRYVSDYYLDSNGGEKLIPLLKKNYTLTDVTEDHINICKVNWRRYYTTNYDKSIELASAKNKKIVECIDLNYETGEYYKRSQLCIHLNGSIDSLTEDSFENSFKLSTSSYISPDSFLSSPWYPHFKRDIERSSAVVFIGYSMYDIEVQKLLIENEYLKDKTYFIIEENPDTYTKFTLSKFGHVLAIGMEGFSKLIADNTNLFEKEENLNPEMQGLSLFKISDNWQEPSDSNVETMLMYGDIKNNFIDSAITEKPKRPYLIKRDTLSKILDFTNNGLNTIVHSEFGNGKSILLKELKPYLSINSFDVYEIIDPDADLIGDLDSLTTKSNISIIIIDNYEEHLNDLLDHFSSTKPKNVIIIGSARSSEHERLRPKLKKIGFIFNDVNIDFLSNEEASQFVNIVDNVGMWGEKAGLSHEKKISFLEFENKLQISLALLELFKAPQIKDRVSLLINNLLTNNQHRDTIFSISLLEVLGLPTKYSLISDVARNNIIYSSEITDIDDFNQLFRVQNNEVVSKSSLFCLSLIRNHFTPTYIVQQMHEIAKAFDTGRNKDFKQEKIFKACLKFSFIERLLPDVNKRTNLRKYYEELKNFVPWLIKDPHYWLQYGMANITFNEYKKAQGYFDQAYSLAAKKDSYYTSNIDTQQARLYMLQDIHDQNYSYTNFQKANKLLASLENDVYKFRQVQTYRDYFDSCYNHLSKGNKVKFEHACKSMVASIERVEQFGEIDSSNQKTVFHAKNSLVYILYSITKNRQ